MKVFTSNAIKRSLQKVIDLYVNIIRVPHKSDADWGTATGYNITHIQKLIKSALDSFFSATWNQNRRNFSVTFNNLEFTKNNSKIVPYFLEAVSRIIGSEFSRQPWFTDTIRKVINDREELGFGYAFVHEDPNSDLGLTISHLHHDSVSFVMGSNGLPCQYIVYEVVREKGNFKYIFSTFSYDKLKKKWVYEKFLITPSSPKTQLPLHNFAFDMYFPISEDMYMFSDREYFKKFRHTGINDPVVEYASEKSREFDYCPILHTRKHTSSDNILGLGTGLMSLTQIQEYHNVFARFKECVIASSRLLLFTRKTGIENTEGANNTVRPQFDSVTANCDLISEQMRTEVSPTAETMEQKLIEGVSSPILAQFSSCSQLGRGFLTSELLTKGVERCTVVLTTTDTTTPIGDQMHIQPVMIDLQKILNALDIYSEQIRGFFDPTSYFNRGKSRMTATEVKQRQALDELDTNDASNPVINDIIAPFIRLILQRNADTIFNPDLSNPKTWIKDFTIYEETVEDGIDVQTGQSVYETIIRFIKDPKFFTIVWDTLDTQLKSDQELQKVQVGLQLIERIAALQQMAPKFNLDGVVEQVRELTGAKVSNVAEIPQVPPIMTQNDQAMLGMGLAMNSGENEVSEYGL